MSTENANPGRARLKLARFTFTIVFGLVGCFVWLFNENVADDYFRIFALAMGTLIVLFAIRILQVNYLISRQLGINNPAGLLPNHIATISFSYIIFVISAHIRIVYGFGEVFRWHSLPFVIIGDILGIAALGVIWRFQEARRQRISNG